MAGNEGTTKTELWSSVVHQPCEDPPESELPSTVDMAAFSTGLNNVEPANQSQSDDGSDSDSDTNLESTNSESESCSQSDDSSDSDSSTSSEETSSRSPSPQFSVTSSQTNGLRLTFASVRKSTSSPTDKMAAKSLSSTSSESNSDSEADITKSPPAAKTPVKSSPNVRKSVRLRNRVAVESKKTGQKDGKKEVATVGKGAVAKAKTRPRRPAKKMAASLPQSTQSSSSTSTDDSSESDDAEILASCSLQEIPQEDLAAILPDQQECDAFDFDKVDEDETAHKNSPQTVGELSGGSDMELPQQAVNALIQRTTESSSDTESHAPPNPTTLYANSLLQQFVEQTQMLNNAPCNSNPVIPPLNLNNNNVNAPVQTEKVARKRGRPKKTAKATVSVSKKQYRCVDPNVSPDSGIQNSPDHVSSPEPDNKKENKKPKPAKKEISKIPITSNRFDRLLYGNADRVLYPPRRKVGRPPLKKGPGRPPKNKSEPKTDLKPNNNGKKPEKKELATVEDGVTKIKYTTLKNLKVMHCKHKPHRHKKYKFKIFKPVSTSGTDSVHVEVDKLVADFIRSCVISPKPKEVSQAKKVSKKRKTTEHSEARKKKKIHVSADVKMANVNNEQRLPLKKRHYLFSDKTKSGEDSSKSPRDESNSNNNSITATTPKKRHRLETAKEDSTSQNGTLDKSKPRLSFENVISELKTTKRHKDEDPAKSDTTKEVKKELGRKKIRKRRPINRTGFPTVKRKKRKVLPTEADPEKQLQCDRVPKEGEEYNKFIARTESCKTDDAKWDGMSECDSLPQDERTETGDVEEISLEASIERLKSRLDDKKKRKRNPVEKTLENGCSKRRFRDISPASSSTPSGDEFRRNKKVPRWRKKYLNAGLFSDYFKEDGEGRTECPQFKRLTFNPQEHPYGLLPAPYHCGRFLRCRKVHFQLPYDLWWQHTHSQLPGRDSIPSWNYRKVRTNVYNVKTTTGACEPQPCNCTPASNCGDDCINRLVLAECPQTHKCQNQRIQKHDWAPGLERFMTVDKGWGVRTKLPIKHGEFILEYVGEVVSDQEFKERMATIYTNDIHHYCLHLDGGMVIDGHRMGGDGRFVNHSCQPNCEIQKWSVNGQFRMALFAIRDIDSAEELTYDYNFSLFNAAEGQECKCGSENCRGVIGGKSQRVRQLPVDSTSGKETKNGRVGRPRKNQAKRTTNVKDIAAAQLVQSAVLPSVKPMSHQQKCFILEHHVFLLRNLTKVRKLRERSVSRQQNNTPTNHSASFISHLNALNKPRNMKTRCLAQAEENPVINQTVKLASVLKDIWQEVVKAKDENDELLAPFFMSMPSKRKVPDFYQKIADPIDLNGIEQNIATGVYLTPESFNSDMNRLFSNYLRYYGNTNEVGLAAIKLKKIYTTAKQQHAVKFQDVLGKKPSSTFVSHRKKNDREEDIIRCICGLPNDEGLMIQCERCMVWQHSECVQADVKADSYHCEQCVPRSVDYEIPLEEFTEHGHRYYLTLLRGDLQLRQGDTVYVLRDITIPGTDRKHTYDTIGKIDYSELDIFRIERLWKDKNTGQRFAYGHHYLRPHETYHEPTRKFFPNEVMRVPLYEAVPVELIISNCWVMDINTYCKGRPIGAPEEHIYICEYRVDKSARLFSKVSKSRFQVCTKSFVFEQFDSRLKISRTYTPHDLDPAMVKPRGRKAHENDDKDIMVPVIPIVRSPSEQKARLNKILLNLLSKMPSKQVVDISYLLEGGRRRKKLQQQQEGKHN